MSDKRYHISIIGGGITGLTAAYYLMRERDERKLPIDFTLIEASDRLGGKIQTWKHDGFVIELGPDSFLERKASAAQLVQDVGLQDDLVRNNTGQAYILHKNRLMPIPEGAVMGIPTRLMPFVTTSLISPLGKLRAAADLVMPAGNHGEDESVGHFFRRRLGDEVIDHLIEPLLSGVYGGNIDQMSLLSTFPEFARLEQKYRSLILAMKSTRPESDRQEKKKGMFQTLKGGLQSLVERVESLLPASSLLKKTMVERIDKNAAGYGLHLSNGQVLQTNAIILTVPHADAQKMLQPYVDIPPLAGTTPTTVATVAMAYPAEQVKLHLEGTGFVVPRKSDYTITACTWTHRKWPHTTPKGKALLRCFVGRENDQAIIEQSDEEIVRVAVKDLQRIMQVGDTPEFYIVNRIQRSIPYVVGHQQWLRTVTEKVETQLPGVLLAGASYAGVGLPDCIDQGKKAVRDVLRFVTNK
ncbi:protoporphyrinogen oxidase [Brevibacillus sp. H7]|uniref:protoporphyrinogen oxidase n=1 Tax=Brevibacillus sp. H7 TaxID=3349138 RepID=UPI003811D637